MSLIEKLKKFLDLEIKYDWKNLEELMDIKIN